jgi:hypothetical protein
LHSGDLEVLINVLSGFTLRHWLKGAPCSSHCKAQEGV